MEQRIEHFVYGTAPRLRRFRASLPAGTTVEAVTGGLVVREPCHAGESSDAAIARIAALALAQGLDYDGHGQAVTDDIGPLDGGRVRDIQHSSFTDRTGIKAGHGFALHLPDGRLGHAVHLGSDRHGYLLLDIRALVTDEPATAAALREAPSRYRQPILVWHTGFATLPIASSAPLAHLPCEVAFRVGIGWPGPDEVALLARRFSLRATDTPEWGDALLAAMAEAGERLPGIDGFSIWTARVGQTGKLRLIEDHAVVHITDEGHWPMPWQPADIGEISGALAGGPDMVAIRDKVT
jgi:hypothetical protein